MVRTTLLLLALLLLATVHGCRGGPTPYPIEQRHTLDGVRDQVWAVAPAVNLSGQRAVDPILQADLLYTQLQTVRNVKAVPVNRVVEAYLALGIDRIDSPEQAAVICEALGVDALLVPTITLWDPYDPPKLGASLALFTAEGVTPLGSPTLDAERVRQLNRSAREATLEPLARPQQARFAQQVGVFDAGHGSTRARLERYARGRTDPDEPAGRRVLTMSMDRYTGFVYHELLGGLTASLAAPPAVADAGR